jgi:hypothetical protein
MKPIIASLLLITASAAHAQASNDVRPPNAAPQKRVNQPTAGQSTPKQGYPAAPPQAQAVPQHKHGDRHHDRRTPVVAAPVYQRPIYSRPIYQQPVYVQPVYNHRHHHRRHYDTPASYWVPAHNVWRRGAWVTIPAYYQANYVPAMPDIYYEAEPDYFSPGFVWVRGHWSWSGFEWHWNIGQWVAR